MSKYMYTKRCVCGDSCYLVAVEQGVKLELTSRLLFCSEVAVAAAAAPTASSTADDSTSPGYNGDYIPYVQRSGSSLLEEHVNIQPEM